MAFDPATVMAISALASAAASGGNAFLQSDEAKRQEKLRLQMLERQRQDERDARAFNQNIAQQQLMMQQRQEAASSPNNALSWMQAIKGLAQGAGKPTSLDVLGYIGGR